MKYELVPQSPQEKAALEHAPHARVLFEPFLPVVVARALMAFVKLGVARALAEAGKSCAELALGLGVREDGLTHLLRVLAASGYVSRIRQQPADDRYELTALSRATLLDGSPMQLDAWVVHNAVHWRMISMLELVLSSQGDRDLHHHLRTPDEWASYQCAMLQTARPAARAVAELLPNPDQRELALDLGGSHGLYGAAICRRFPPMRCMVVDLPEAVGPSRKLGDKEGISDIVEYVEGDILQFDLGRHNCDVVFMGNIVHHFDDEKLKGLLLRSRNALRRGGIVAIWDMAPPPEQSDLDLVAEGFSLLFYLSSASSCRPPDVYMGLLREAGFEQIAVHRGPSPTHLLVTGRSVISP